MRVYNLTSTQHALSNIALRRLKVARFNDLNDPFELLAVDVASRDLRAGILAKKEQVHSKEGLLCFSRNWKIPFYGVTMRKSIKALALDLMFLMISLFQ